MKRPLIGMMFCSACSTTMVHPDKATPVPPQRVFSFQQNENPLENGKLVITRDKGIMYDAFLFGLRINGQRAACFDQAETGQFFVPAGEVILQMGPASYTWTNSECMDDNTHKSDPRWTSRETTMRSKDTKYFRLLVTQGDTFDVQRFDP